MKKRCVLQTIVIVKNIILLKLRKTWRSPKLIHYGNADLMQNCDRSSATPRVFTAGELRSPANPTVCQPRQPPTKDILIG